MTIKRVDRLNQTRVLYLNGFFDVEKEMKKTALQLLVIGLIVAVAVNYLNGLLFGVWAATETNKKKKCT